ncbi:MAG: hypothetical protein AAFV27_02145 [Pseudomonadota bacterium]
MKKPVEKTVGKAAEAAAREARLAEALRANLKRRKAQVKTRKQADDSES